MARFNRTFLYVLVGAVALVVLLVALFVVLTRTDFGVERAGRFAVERLRSSVNGELRVGQVTSRGLLSGVTLHGVAIDDEQGRPFLRADSARLAYRVRTLLGGDIAFDRLTLYAPRVVIERLPGQDDWNFERIFPGDTTTVPDTLPDEDLVLIDDATIIDGQFTIRLPWEPDPPVEPDDTARLILEEVPGGIARVLRFDAVNGRIPRIVWDAPGDEPQLFRISELAARAYIWETPVEVQGMEATVTRQDSLISFDIPRLRLPSSELSVVGQVVIADDNRYDVEIQGDDLAFADFQWLYPALPEDGGGALEFRMQSQEGDRILWLARDANLRTGGTRLAGSFGVITGDTLYFTNVDLEASPLDLELLQSLLPGELPLEGLLIGTVEVEGPVSSLQTRGDLRYRLAGGAGESWARWTGGVRAIAPYAVSGLEADVRELDLGQLTALVPDLRLRGVATGRVRASGSLQEGLRLAGDAHLERHGRRSAVRGSGQLALAEDRSTFDLRLDAEPLALDLLAEQFPGLPRLTGEARGGVSIVGGLDDLRVEADLLTSAGAVVLDGRLALDGPEPRYQGEGSVTDFQLHRVISGLPDARITARFDLDGSGRSIGALAGRGSVNIFNADVAGVSVHGGYARARASDGRAHLDTLSVATSLGDLAAAGVLGLSAGREGTLRFRAVADSLAVLAPLFPGEPIPDTAMAPAAPLGGRVIADGSIRGTLDRWELSGTATLEDGLYGNIGARRARAEVEWAPHEERLALDGWIDSLAIGHRQLPRAHLVGRYAAGSGELVLDAEGPGAQRLDLAGAFTRTPTGAEYRLDELAVRTRDGSWVLSDTATGRVGSEGVAVESLVLARTRDAARIEAAGVLPWSEEGTIDSAVAAFSATVENVRIGELLRLSQSDTVMDGLVRGHVAVGGTAAAPVMRASVVASSFRYNEATLDSVVGDLRYRDRVLEGSVVGWRAAGDIVRGDGHIPVELALGDRENRRLERPMHLRLQADSVPAGLVAFLAPGFRRVDGTVHGDFVIGGTPVDPTFRGELRLADGSGYFDHSGVRYRSVNAVATMRETLLALEGSLRTESGSGEIRGTLDLTRPTDPAFDLQVTARGLDASRRRDVVAVADGRAYLRGRYSQPVVSGDIRFTSGELNLGEIRRQYQIVQLDSWFFEEVDTANVSVRPELQNPFLANIQVTDATISLDRNFWIRGPQLNVEIAGQLAVEYNRRSRDLRLTGPLEAVRGSYELQVVQGVPGRRFDIRDGTIDFVGTPGIDPNVDITAQYRLRRAQGDPIDVVARLGGSLQSPRVSLSSDTDLPISESDLASYIIFGRPTGELTQMESDVVTGQLGQLGQGMMGFAMPTVYGLGSSMLQSLLMMQSVFSLDHVALTSVQQELTDLNALDLIPQVELGGYAPRPFQDLFLVTSWRFPGAEAGAGSRLGMPRLGIRAEWRFRPTWTAEGFVEDRFARMPSFGLGEIEDRTVYGLSLFREWGY